MNKAILLIDNINNLSDLNVEISSQRKTKVEHFSFIDDKKRCILAEVLLKKGLKYFNIYDYELIYNENNKPYIKDSNIYFNISHSGDYVAIIMSDVEVGIDIQKIKELKLNIAKRFFHENEYQRIIDEKDVNKQTELFYIYWTMKEAYTKAIGKGLAIPLNSFDVTDSNFDYNFQEIEIDDNYKCFVCSKDKLEIEKIKVI